MPEEKAVEVVAVIGAPARRWRHERDADAAAFADAAARSTGDRRHRSPIAPASAPRRPDALVRQHLPLVRRIAWHVHGSMSNAVEVEDLVQVGLVALVEAAATFEDRGGVDVPANICSRGCAAR